MKKYFMEIALLMAEHARARLNDTASTLRKSPQRIKYAISTLKKEGILTSPYCLFDYSYFGLVLFKVYFKGGYIGEKDKEEIISLLKGNSYITSIYEMNGEYDLVVEIASPNPSRFNKVLRNIIRDIPTLNKYTIILNLVSHIYPSAPPEGGISLEHQREIVIGGDREREAFSEDEQKVIRQFLINPIIRISSLSRSTHLTQRTVADILRRLHDKRIIRGFKYVVNGSKTGIYKQRLFLKIHNLSKERERHLMHYMAETREITQLNKTVGNWDMEIDMEASANSSTRQLIVSLRETFKDIIEDFKIIEVYTIHKKSCIPEYLFASEPA